MFVQEDNSELFFFASWDLLKFSKQLFKQPVSDAHIILIVLSCYHGRSWFQNNSRRLMVHCWPGLVFSPPYKCACSAQVDQIILLSLISVIWPVTMLRSNSFWSLPFQSFMSFSFPLSSFFFFSQLNCKYQVPFILFCYFCYYYIVVLVIFFSSRPAQQQPDCLSSFTVCKYDFISVPDSWGEKNRTKCFIFILSPSISLFITSLFSHKCCHNCFIYCIVAFFVLFWRVKGFFHCGG